MNVYLATLGCRLNEAELQTWTRRFHAAGHVVGADPAGADVVIVNSCAVTSGAAKKSRQLVRRVHRSNPSAKLVMTGCYASLQPDDSAALEGVDLVIDNRDKGSLVQRVLQQLDLTDMPALAQAPGESFAHRSGRTRAFVKVQDGCRNRCTFCIVTVARGEERSRSIPEVCAEVRDLHGRGHHEVVLTGVHLGGYGEDGPTSLHDLVAAIVADTDVPRIRLGSLEPWDLPEHFFELWRHPRVMPHLHLPLQSGSDTVLRRMSRRCPTAAYAKVLQRARDRVPGLVATTDLIVGFPGETDAEFAATLAFIDAMDFAHMHIFQYSPRAGTKAARLPGQVAPELKRQRSAEAHCVAAAMKARVLRRFLGATRPVLWERANEAGHMTGYTDNYLRLELAAPRPELSGRITPGTVTDLVDGHRLTAIVPRG